MVAFTVQLTEVAIRGRCGRRVTCTRLSRLPGNACIAKITQRTPFLSIGNSPLATPREHGVPRARTANPSDRGSEYDYPHHRKARAKLRLGRPSVRLESSTLASSTTDPQNGHVVAGTWLFRDRVVEIVFVVSLLDPSATSGRVLLSIAARTLWCHPKCVTRRRRRVALYQDFRKFEEKSKWRAV